MKKLDKKALTYFFIEWFIGLFFLLGFFVLPLFILLFGLILEGDISYGVFSIGLFTLTIGFLGFTSVTAYITAKLTYDNFRYGVEAGKVVIDKGIIIKRHILIPFEKVQNIDITKGLIERGLGLVSLHIQTAGMGYWLAEGIIPGISPEEADKLKAEILSKTSRNQNL